MCKLHFLVRLPTRIYCNIGGNSSYGKRRFCTVGLLKNRSVLKMRKMKIHIVSSIVTIQWWYLRLQNAGMYLCMLNDFLKALFIQGLIVVFLLTWKL